MSYLENFTQQEKDLLIALPFRTGLWVSESDQGGGSQSAEAEMNALQSIITGFSEDFLKSEFVEEIMKQTLEHRARWKEWSVNLEGVPAECQQAAEVLRGKVDNKDGLSYRQALMDIATSIAMTYRELDAQTPVMEKFSAYAGYYWKALQARLKNQQAPRMDETLNISKAERRILDTLSGALRVDLEGNPKGPAG